MILHVNVTAARIKRGKPQSSKACPVSLAIKAHKAVSFASVGNFFAEIHYFNERDEDASWHDTLPKSAQQFIADFDDLKEVAPFQFDLEI